MLICIPVVSVIWLVTLIGIPLGLLSIAAYLALLMLGYVAAAAALGDWLLKRLQPGHVGVVRWRIAAAIGGIFLLALLGQVPLLGGLVALAAMLLGVGALGLQMQRTAQPAAL
jgi:hypothetical protein